MWEMGRDDFWFECVTFEGPMGYLVGDAQQLAGKVKLELVKIVGGTKKSVRDLKASGEDSSSQERKGKGASLRQAHTNTFTVEYTQLLLKCQHVFPRL